MKSQASLTLRNRNPDVLTSIANLSNDEIFTPPAFANEMLDLIEKEWARNNGGLSIWEDSSVTFLDPFAKSGVFLREITRRLIKGLEKSIPGLQERVDHILTKQVFGVAITSLTALVARRSVYCSKLADGKHSICTKFEDPSGNIWFERQEHTWVGGKTKLLEMDARGTEVEKVTDGTCKFCGAKQKEWDRGSEAESHAYSLLHTEDINQWTAKTFGEDMQFDVIVGNPPYQLNDGGFGSSAGPIYDRFVRQAKALEPRMLTMVIPSRWFTGGKGLDSFRKEMLGDRRVRSIVDFILSEDAFPGVKNLNGGVCYFLWDRDNPGSCTVTTVEAGDSSRTVSKRKLDEFDVFIRRPQVVAIVKAVKSAEEASFSHRVSSRKPFGLPTNFHGSESRTEKKSILLHGSGRKSWVSRNDLVANADWADRWKVLVPRASDGNEIYPLPIWDSLGPFASGPGEACSETYLVASLAESKEEAENISMYMRTKFFRFLVWARKSSQDNKADLFNFVPDVEYHKGWTDQELYARYQIPREDSDFIESMIRPMEAKSA